MCYTFRASIINGTISLITSVIVYRSTSNPIVKSLSLFCLYVSLMQWYDAIFWTTSSGKNAINYVFTKVAMITNHLQPIILYYLVAQHVKMTHVSKLVLGLYCVCALIYSIYAFNVIDYTVVTHKSAPMLDWKWNNLPGAQIMYFLFLMVFTFVSLNVSGILSIVMLMFTFGSLFFSYYTFKGENVGQMWCVISAYAPLFLALFR